MLNLEELKQKIENLSVLLLQAIIKDGRNRNPAPPQAAIGQSIAAMVLA